VSAQCAHLRIAKVGVGAFCVAAANNLPPENYDRELLLRRREQAEIASNIDKWLSSKICGKAC
jgi:hypothetical protein